MAYACPLPRSYIRHPTGIEIDIACESPAAGLSRRLKDVSLGGLACCSPWPLVPDTVVNLRIHIAEPAYSLRGKVVWCERHGGRFELGIAFLDEDDAFRARMVEQICHIEAYRENALRSEGRVLTSEEAAAEWVARYADCFPGSEG